MAKQIDPALIEKLKGIRLLVLDVDGVMTDGGLTYSESGEEMRRFDIKDGAGIYMGIKAGLEVGILSGKTSTAVKKRADELGMRRVVQGAFDKSNALQEMLADGAYLLSEVAYMGDDMLDLPAMRAAGLSACPADAHAEVLARADYVCERPGGHGAVRELIDLILEVQGKLGPMARGFWEGTLHA